MIVRAHVTTAGKLIIDLKTVSHGDILVFGEGL